MSSLGAGTRGVWTRAEALAALTPDRVRGLLARGTWQVLLPGIYADGGFEPDAGQRAMAAVLASGRGAVAAGRTAARVWRLPLVDDDDPATGAHEVSIDDVAVRRHLRTLSHNGRVVRRRELALPPQDVTVLSGLSVTTPLRTLADLARLLPLDAAVCAVDAALQRRLVTADELRGGPALRRVASLADERAQSPPETLARLLLQPVLPGLVPQVPVYDRAVRLIAVLDLADEDLRLAVELDGRRGHAGEQMVAKDRRRDLRTEALGWTTVRGTWFDVRRRPDEFRERVLAAARRCRAA